MLEEMADQMAGAAVHHAHAMTAHHAVAAASVSVFSAPWPYPGLVGHTPAAPMANVKAPAMTSADTPCIFFMRSSLGDVFL